VPHSLPRTGPSASPIVAAQRNFLLSRPPDGPHPS
jgi:hypothetical protein